MSRYDHKDRKRHVPTLSVRFAAATAIRIMLRKIGSFSGCLTGTNKRTYLVEICALTQRPCAEGGAWYQNALVFKPQHTISQLESGFSVWIQERGKDVL